MAFLKCVASKGTSGNTIVLMQGGLSSTDGQPLESNARVYETGYLSLNINNPSATHGDDDVTILNAAGNGIICYLRTYGDNESFIGAVGKISDNIAGYYFVSGNDSSSNIGISDTIKIHRRENSSAIKLRIAFAYENKTTPITPSDLEGRVITVDGVSYTLVAGE